MNVTKTIPLPELLTIQEWHELGNVKDGVNRAFNCLYLHEVAGNKFYVKMYEHYGMRREQIIKYSDAHIKSTPIYIDLAERCRLNEDNVKELINRVNQEHQLYGVVNCFDTGDWLVKQTGETTLWNEYVPGTFFWDRDDVGLCYDHLWGKEHDALKKYIFYQCSRDERLMEYFFKCLARKFYNPFCLMGNIWVFSGGEGTGKSMLLDLVANCFGNKFATTTQPLNDAFSASFNPYAVWVVHELTQLSNYKHGMLRDRATNERIHINVKYQVQREYKNIGWFLLAANPSGDERSHFEVTGEGRRYRFMTSHGDASIFIPKFKKLGMLHEKGQGFADNVVQTLFHIVSPYYDPDFTPGGTLEEAKEYSCRLAWNKHVATQRYLSNTSVQDKAMKLNLGDKVLMHMANQPHKQFETDKRYRAIELVELYGLEEIASESKLSPALGRIIGLYGDDMGITTIHSNTTNSNHYIIKGDVLNKWLSESKHVKFDQATYTAWYNMNLRCYDKKHNSYKSYGAKDVQVCEEWRKTNPHGWYNFLADMGIKPEGRCQLGRKEDRGDYKPGNVSWEMQS